MPISEADKQHTLDQHEEAFRTWMASPTTKLLLSLLPPSEPPELLTTLLRSAFDVGTVSGAASLMEVLAQKFLEKK